MYSKKFRLPIGKKKTTGQRTLSSPYFLVKFKQNYVGHNRFGIIISNHSVKTSAKRHFWKRIIADILQALPNLRTDLLVIASPEIEKANKKIIREEFDKIFKKLSSSAA